MRDPFAGSRCFLLGRSVASSPAEAVGAACLHGGAAGEQTGQEDGSRREGLVPPPPPPSPPTLRRLDEARV